MKPSALSHRSGSLSSRRAAADWYARREQLHLERAKLRAAVLVDLAAWLAAPQNADATYSIEDVMRSVLWNGSDTFAAAGEELREVSVRLAPPSMLALIAWHKTADARLGEYPRSS